MIERSTMTSRIVSPVFSREIDSGLRVSEACVISTDTPISEALDQAGANPSTRVVCVVDRQGHLTGLIGLDVLLKCFLVQMSPESLITAGLDPNRVARIARLITARTASDLMEPPISLSSERSESHLAALKEMTLRGLLALPLVDGHGKVLGQVDAVHLIRFCSERANRAASRTKKH